MMIILIKYASNVTLDVPAVQMVPLAMFVRAMILDKSLMTIRGKMTKQVFWEGGI
jgi:hypothetical protein